MHRMMLKDEMLVLEAQRLVREERLNAEWAVKRAVRKIKSAFHEQADEYFKERRADVDYVGERIIKNLLGQAPDVDEAPPEGAIIVAHDLSPADTALLLHERKVAAFVTDSGAKTSHTAIVARALEVPAVVGVGRITALVDRGDWIIVDGSRGVVVINPTPGERSDYEAARERYRLVEEDLLRTRDLPARTQDDVTVRLAGNIEFVEEVPSLLSHGGDAIGLYRTEFLFLGRPDLPSEEEHYQNYRAGPRGARAAPGHHPDVRPRRRQAPGRHARARREPGARAARDPLLPRASRTCSARSCGRCSARRSTGTSRIMFPMISGVAELRAARRALDEVRAELERAGTPMKEDIPVGIMIELPERGAHRRPARARVRLLLHRDERPHPVHDRDRPAEQGRRLPLQAAPPRRAAHARHRSARRAAQAGIPVSMCGEMAGEPVNALVLVGLGVSELSMNGPSIPLVKRVIRAAKASDGRALVARLLALTTADDIEREVKVEMARRFPGLLGEDAVLGPVGG